MQVLQTTKFVNYDLSRNYNPFYIEDFKYKLSYLKNISASNHSNRDLCGAVFLTYLSLPIWVTVGCNDSLPHNYFLCERNENSSHHQHTLNLIVCPKHYTYIKAQCWLITTKQLSRHINTDPPISLLASFLTSWSLGHASRSIISLRPLLPCLSSNDFPNQRIKKWVKSVRCNSSNVLKQRAPIMYHSICQGEFSSHKVNIIN